MEWSKEQLQAMTQDELKAQVSEVFKQRGFSVERPPKSHGSGADLIVKRHRDDDSLESIAVQVRKLARQVGLMDLMELLYAKSQYACEDALVISASGFTATALKGRDNTGCWLWEIDDLMTYAASKRQAYEIGAARAPKEELPAG
jgi:HJR/Mrr/RecB family endonuclease